MQITDKGKGISERIKQCILEQDKRSATEQNIKKKTASILMYKLAKSTKFLENVL